MLRRPGPRAHNCPSTGTKFPELTYALSLSTAVPPRFVPGNLPLDSLCARCDEPAGTGPGLRDLRCIWCQTCVHTECRDADSEVGDRCDYGRHR